MNQVRRLSMPVLLVCATTWSYAQAPPTPAPASPAPATAAATTTSPDTGATPADDKVLLRLHLQSGQSYLMQVTSESKVTEILPRLGAGAPQRLDMNMTNKMGMLYQVTGVDADGKTALKVTYHSIQFKSNTLMDNKATPAVNYDSSQLTKASNPAASVFKALIGQSFSVTVTPDGHVAAVQGLEAIYKRMFAAMGRNRLQQADIAAFQKTFEGLLSARALKQTIEKSTFGYPTEAIAPGASWKDNFDLSASFPLMLHLTRTLQARKNGTASITEKGNIQLSTTHLPLPISVAKSNMKMAFHLAGTQDGTTELDEATGFIQKAQRQQRFSGTINMSGLPKVKGAVHSPQNITVPIYSKTLISITVAPFPQ